MRDLRQVAEFLLEAIQGRGINALQSLEGDDFLAFAIEGSKDDPHAAVA